MGLRIGFYGAGAMAAEIAGALPARGHEPVAAYDPRSPAGPLAALHVTTPEALIDARPDVVVHATPWGGDLAGQLVPVLSAGCHVVSINGLAHLPASDPGTAEAIDAAARAAGVAAIGAGINPGFVLDLVPIFFAGACTEVTGVRATRVADVRPYGDAVLGMYGIGLAEAEWHDAVEQGRIGLHREIVHSAHLIAHALGIAVESVEERKLPVVEDDRVVGFRHLCHARPGIELELQGLLAPPGAAETTVVIEGDPNLRIVMSDGLTDQGGRVVAARVLGMLPWIMGAEPGLRSPAELPVALGLVGR